MKNWKMYLVALLRAAINEAEPDNPPEGLDWEALYQLADYHSVACTAYYGIIRLPKEKQPEPEILNKFQKAMQLVLGRESMQHFELQGVLDTFEENGIVCVPLKGWLMKHLYPRPDMRSMCDVDILVHPEDMEKIPALMKQHGFELEDHGENHDGYMKPPILSTEIHWALFGPTSPYQTYFAPMIENVYPAEGKQYESRMTWEDFYLHLIAHLAKHFDNCGTGLRSFMDVYLFREKFRDQLDEVYLQEELEKLGLRKFTGVMEDVARCMFAEGLSEEERNRYETLNEFVFHTGTYGTKEADVAAKLTNQGANKGKYLISRFFPNLSFMRMQYPVLEKAPVLLPIFWVARGFRSVFLRRDRLSAELRMVKKADDSTIQEMEEIKRLSGLIQ